VLKRGTRGMVERPDPGVRRRLARGSEEQWWARLGRSAVRPPSQSGTARRPSQSIGDRASGLRRTLADLSFPTVERQVALSGSPIRPMLARSDRLRGYFLVGGGGGGALGSSLGFVGCSDFLQGSDGVCFCASCMRVLLLRFRRWWWWWRARQMIGLCRLD
jgi:hypothetical protein